MSFARHYVQRELERVQDQNPRSQLQRRDSLELPYVYEYRERQHQRLNATSSRTQHRMRKIQDALAHLQHGSHLIVTKLTVLHDRVREAKKTYYSCHGQGYGSSRDCECVCSDCLQCTRLAIYYRDLENDRRRKEGLYFEIC